MKHLSRFFPIRAAGHSRIIKTIQFFPFFSVSGLTAFSAQRVILSLRHLVPSAALLFVTITAYAANDDVWDVTQGATVTAHSGTLGGPNEIREMFGDFGFFPERGVTLFRDFRRPGTIHWVEWQTPGMHAIAEFNLLARHDGHVFAPAFQCDLITFFRDAQHRGFDHFTLKAWNPNTSSFDIVLYDADIPLGDDNTTHPNENARLYDAQGLVSARKDTLDLTDSAATVVATNRWRAEFRQVGCASNESGPRIFELDGFEPTVITVDIDIKPGSDPNCFNINGAGVVPVAILGSDTFDVANIDQSSLLFGGLEVRVRGKKGPLCGFEYSNADPYLDLVCHFEDDPDAWNPGDGEATLTGNLLDGSEFEGTDSICLVR